MNNLTRLTGASLVAVLHAGDSAFCISDHDRADPRAFTFLPRRIDVTTVCRMLLQATGDQTDRLRHITVVEGGEVDNFTSAAKLALVAIAGATGASLSSVPFMKARKISDDADCANAAQVAVAIEIERRKRKGQGEHLGDVVLTVDHVRQLRNETRDLRQHVGAA